MDFDEMRKSMENALQHMYEFPLMSASYLAEKSRVEHALTEAPKALMDKLNVPQFMERTKLEFPEVAYTGWEDLINFVKDYERLKNEVSRLSADLKRQRHEVLSILQIAMDQITRQLREPIDERTPPEYGGAHDHHQEG